MTRSLRTRRAVASSAIAAASRQAQAGVTLLELLIVLSIMAIVAALVVPMFGSGVSNTDLKSAARQVAAGLRLARSEAVAKRQDTRVMLDLEHRTFQVERDSHVHALPRELEMKLFTAQSDLVSDRVGAIRFFPDGGSNGGRVTLASGERKYEVDIDWLTGRVAILD
jgi:general secretion pathway protein H